MIGKRFIVLLLAFGQIVSAYFGGFTGEDAYSTAIITPAGYAFSIWGVIIVGCIVYSIYQLLPSQRKNSLYDTIALPLSVTFLGFSVWIYLAARDYIWATVITFIVMLAGLWKAYPHLVRKKESFTPFQSTLFFGTFGLYIAWSTVAIPLNATAALVNDKTLLPDERSLIAYIIILMVVLLNALIGQTIIGRNYYYTGTVIWAFIAVAVRTNDQNSITLTTISLLAAIVAVVYAFSVRNKKPLTLSLRN